MDTALPRARRSDAVRNHDLILDAARAEFARVGGDAQMDAIAAGAGVGVGTVYRHFPTKQALVAELVRQRFERFAAMARGALDVADPWEAFAGYMTANARACLEDAGSQHVFLAADPGLADVLAIETGLYASAGLLIDRGHRAGVIREDFVVEDVGMLLCGIASAMARPARGWDWERHLGFVLDGLRAPSA